MKSKIAIIHFETRRENKTRWVKQAQSEGKKLTEWIADTLNANSQPLEGSMLTKITIPDTVDFSDLHLSRDNDGAVSFDWQPLEAICTACNLDPSLLQNAPEDNVSGLIVAWYAEHLRHGGKRDPVADDLIAETQAENNAGQPFSLPPGRA